MALIILEVETQAKPDCEKPLDYRVSKLVVATAGAEACHRLQAGSAAKALGSVARGVDGCKRAAFCTVAAPAGGQLCTHYADGVSDSKAIYGYQCTA